jgi:hypothetical protein
MKYALAMPMWNFSELNAVLENLWLMLAFGSEQHYRTID